MLRQAKEKDNEIAELRRNKKDDLGDLHKQLQEKNDEVDELRHSQMEVVNVLQTTLDVVNKELENLRHERELQVKQEDDIPYGAQQLDQRSRVHQYDSRYPLHSPQSFTGTWGARVDAGTDPETFRLDDLTKLETKQLELHREMLAHIHNGPDAMGHHQGESLIREVE